MRILITEDDKNVYDFVSEGLKREGFFVDIATNGREALKRVAEQKYDVILLDILMPELDGLSVLKKLRGTGFNGAILLVTSKDEEEDIQQGLDSGADDYVIKPFRMGELAARIRAVSRRTGHAAQGKNVVTRLSVGPLQLDLLKREVKKSGKTIPLTKKEFDILECLMRRPGQVVSQSVLAEHVLGVDFLTNSNSLEVHMAHLRSKIDGKSPESFIRTIRGCGYALDA